ncbi:hypothetical protein BDF20DRAFT_542518 [Mycotypha africana]|uniref:uncharacterized protein n=1 Tax=Mycotypha africana TaxID=64632 RepID=UPI00230015D5|nr:uncharacterized protein BDF20DRAFT_542518 [Mycotypha africana]KAI8977086.1 hypothetical protein BDF20DRAFT_542518 [Mycotypha africana]
MRKLLLDQFHFQWNCELFRRHDTIACSLSFFSLSLSVFSLSFFSQFFLSVFSLSFFSLSVFLSVFSLTLSFFSQFFLSVFSLSQFFLSVFSLSFFSQFFLSHQEQTMAHLCHICEKEFPSPTKLYNHGYDVHVDTLQVTIDKKTSIVERIDSKFSCPDCPSRLSTTRSFNDHLKKKHKGTCSALSKAEKSQV